ncbi:MAG: hypothetical protein HC788_09070 [Sphingopyxis sp.]|nr:hypothetical protein [Sphingopyxis sp.]
MINAGHIDRAVTIGSEDIESRLSGRCTHAIAAKLKSPEAELLKKAATEAIREGGLVIDPAVTSQLNQKADRVADLLVPIQDDPREAWRFAEDGAASLIWLRT